MFKLEVVTVRRVFPSASRALVRGLLFAVACTALAVAGSPRAWAGAYDVTLNYVVRFYPRWFTFRQQNLGQLNTLAGPASMSPLFGFVVAPNDDTYYASAYVDVRREPVVVTIPSTTVTYSILTMDAYGDIFTTNMVAGRAGKYALVSKGWKGDLPAGVKKVPVPVDFVILIIRADRFHDGVDQSALANLFRLSLRLANLTKFERDPTAGQTLPIPLYRLSARMKSIADQQIMENPTTFLTQLQQGVHSPTTPPLSQNDAQLARQFDILFNQAKNGSQRGPGNTLMADINAGAQAALGLIINNYLSHRGTTNWINFKNIGEWGPNYVDRASIAEYIEFGNNFSTAAYYHAFVDRLGHPLDCSIAGSYKLTFTKDQIPEAKRFWSLTAYVPGSITLVDNTADKYVVGSYTPGLVTAPDGSITIYMQPDAPIGVPVANWLPVPKGPFNVMLRVYGPKGSVAKGTFVPPALSGFGFEF
jgi:hypothetical protein